MDNRPDPSEPASASSLPKAAEAVTAQTGGGEGSSGRRKPEPDQSQSPPVSAALPRAPLPEASAPNGHAPAAVPAAPADHTGETGRSSLHGSSMHWQSGSGIDMILLARLPDQPDQGALCEGSDCQRHQDRR